MINQNFQIILIIVLGLLLVKLGGNKTPIGFILSFLMPLHDIYDALISERIYKRALSHDEVKDIIINTGGSHFDPVIVKAFLEVEEQFVAIAREYADRKK